MRLKAIRAADFASIVEEDNVYYKELVENERVTTLAQALDMHSVEEDDANRGYVIATIIGGVILFVLLLVVIWMMMVSKRRQEQGGSGATQRI